MDISDQAAKLAHEAGDKITHAGNQAAEALCDKGEQLKNAEQCIVKNCRSYINDNPFTSIGIAVVSGFVISRLLSSR